MSSSEHRSSTHTTEISVVTGERYRVAGDVKDIELSILNAARGSIMEFAWFIDAESREDLAVNPEHVVTLRRVDTPGQ